MVCCAFLSVLIAAFLWLARRAVPRPALAMGGPLAWRLHHPTPTKNARDEKSQAAPFSVSARLKSVAFALQGLRFMLRHEHNAWVHFAATVLIIVAGVAFEVNSSDWRWLIAAVLWVWFAEAMNTAFEHICDVVSPGKNESVRIAKDVAAGGVLISAIGAVILGALIMMPYIAAPVSMPALDFALCRAAL